MFVLLKDLLQQLMDETLVIIDSDLDRLRHEKADLIAEMEAMRDEMQGIINTRDATIESLQEQVAELTENLRDANKKIKAVAEEMRDLKKNNSELTLKLKQAEAEATRTAVANRQLTAIKNEHMKCQANINQLQARLQVATDGRSGQPGDIESMTAEAKATLMKKLLQDRPSVFAIVGVEFLVEQGLPDPLDVAVFKILLKKFIPDDCPDPLAALAKFMGAQPLKMLAKIVQGLLESGMDPETLFGSLDVTKDPNAMWKMAKGILGPMVADESGESLLGLMAGLLGEDSGSDLMKRLRVRAEVDAAFDIETQTETEEAEAEAVPEEPQEEEQVVETKPNRIVIETVGPRTGDKVWGPKGAQKPMTVPNMIKVIAQIYEEKTIADEVDDRENNTRQTMAEFVKDYFIRTYGLKSLATKNLHALAAGVRKSYKSSMRLQVFGLIAGIITLPSREGCYVEGSGDLICDALGSLFPKSSISERLSKENPVAPLEALQEAIVSALRMAKDGGGIRSAERIMELCMEGGDGEGLDVDQWMWIMVEEWVRYSFAGEPAIMKLFYEIDDNASGILSEAEFVEGVLRMEGVSEDRAVEAFAAYAVDRGGVSVLNEEAFAKLLRGCDDVCSAAGVQLPDIPEEGAEGAAATGE